MTGGIAEMKGEAEVSHSKGGAAVMSHYCTLPLCTLCSLSNAWVREHVHSQVKISSK